MGPTANAPPPKTLDGQPTVEERRALVERIAASEQFRRSARLHYLSASRCARTDGQLRFVQMKVTSYDPARGVSSSAIPCFPGALCGIGNQVGQFLVRAFELRIYVCGTPQIVGANLADVQLTVLPDEIGKSCH